MTRDQVLLMSQRNEILKLVSDAGLDPVDFHWHGLQGAGGYGVVAQQLEHGPSGYYFKFYLHDEGYVGQCAPGRAVPAEMTIPVRWNDLVPLVGQWLKNLRREINAPDLWAEVAKVKELASAVKTLGPDRPFTTDERTRIAERLEDIHRFLLATRKLRGGQDAFVRDRLNYLKEASGRQSREAWMLMFMGVILSFILSSIVPPEAVQEFLRLVVDRIMGTGGLLTTK
jgi:hypothetical protein